MIITIIRFHQDFYFFIIVGHHSCVFLPIIFIKNERMREFHFPMRFIMIITAIRFHHYLSSFVSREMPPIDVPSSIFRVKFVLKPSPFTSSVT